MFKSSSNLTLVPAGLSGFIFSFFFFKILVGNLKDATSNYSQGRNIALIFAFFPLSFRLH